MDFDTDEGSYKGSSYNPNSSRSSRNNRRRRLFFLAASVTIATIFLYVIFHGSSDNGDEVIINSPQALTLPKPNSLAKSNGVTLEDILKGRFYPKPFNGTWTNGETIQYMSNQNELISLKIPTMEKTVILSSPDFGNLLSNHSPYKTTISPSKRYALISFDPQRIYRYSTVALYVVVDLQIKSVTPIGAPPTPGFAPQSDPYRLQLAEWSETKDAIVFVHSNDVYLLSDIHSIPKRVSFTGQQYIYNGVTDWVYEEEMFNTNTAVHLHDRDTLAFITFNDSLVDLIQFSIYGQFQYPVSEAIPYPKSGRTNPTAVVSIHSNGVTKEIVMPPVIAKEHYIGSIKWTDSPQQPPMLLIQTLNRFQNISHTLLCNVNAFCEIIRSESSQQWIDNSPITQLSPDNFITISPITQKTGKTFKHLLLFSKNSVQRVITHGNFSVDKVLAVDGNLIFFQTQDNQLRSVNTKTMEIKCHTCSFPCQYNDISMDGKSGKYFINNCHNGFESVPTIKIHEISESRDPKTLTTWERNGRLAKNLQSIHLPIVKEISFKTEDGFLVQGKMLLPKDYDEGRKMPLLIDVYGGPGTTRIVPRFNVDWGISMVTSKNVAYAFIDGRGSGGNREEEFVKSIYRNLGTVEIEDQINGAKALLSKYSSILDPNKTAIWGWSYGGFVSSTVMGVDTENVFKCGISVAPVTNWAFYDTIYTERYLSTPTDNFQGYNKSDVTHYIDNFRKKKGFLLVHGNADDNVHYQQSMYLARALELSDILFNQQSYPDENHSLASVRPHLYHTIENFLFSKCF